MLLSMGNHAKGPTDPRRLPAAETPVLLGLSVRVFALQGRCKAISDLFSMGRSLGEKADGLDSVDGAEGAPLPGVRKERLEVTQRQKMEIDSQRKTYQQKLNDVPPNLKKDRDETRGDLESPRVREAQGKKPNMKEKPTKHP